MFIKHLHIPCLGRRITANINDLFRGCGNYFSYNIFLHSCARGIGNNNIRAKVLEKLLNTSQHPALNVIHDKSICSRYIDWHQEGGILVAANAAINAFSKIGKGVICNTSCCIDHECIIGDYVHIAPSAVLCGGVTIGNNSFIGANTVVKSNISIGKNVISEAGSVITQDIPDNTLYPTPSV